MLGSLSKHDNDGYEKVLLRKESSPRPARHCFSTFMYISMPFSPRQLRELTKFKVMWAT